MDATDQTTDQTTSQIAGRNGDHLDVLGDGPLGVPVRRLWVGLDSLVRAGHLRGAELELSHPDRPCFLLDVAPGLPRLYVEMFLDDSPSDEECDPEEREQEEEWRPLLVLANWLGEDADPAIFELDPSVLEGDPSLLGPALAPVLDHVLRMTQARG